MNGRDGVDRLLMFVASAVHVFNHMVIIITFIDFSLSLTHTHTHTQSKFGVCNVIYHHNNSCKIVG